MGLFRRNRHREAMAGLEAELARLHYVADDLAQRVNRLESRPLPRPNPVTPWALDRVERLAEEASRTASVARAEVAVRMSTIDGMVAELDLRLAEDRDALRVRIDDLTNTLEHQAAHLEAQAGRLAASTRNGAALEPADESGLRANQTRIAGDLARLSIELREEVARLAGSLDSEPSHSGTNGHTNGDSAAASAAGVVDLRS